MANPGTPGKCLLNKCVCVCVCVCVVTSLDLSFSDWLSRTQYAGVLLPALACDPQHCVNQD